MVETLIVSCDLPPNRQTRITLPPGLPLWPTDLVIVVAPRLTKPYSTPGDLLQSSYFGMWRDRTDAADSCEFAAKLRSCAWRFVE